MGAERRNLRVTRIYTKTGDDGTTGLIGGQRVSKDSLRIETYGTVDELNALLGVIRSLPLDSVAEETLLRVQDHLFTLSANLAVTEAATRARHGVPPITVEHITLLEKEIDEMQAALEPLRKFILPGGSKAAALLHFARAVARRAERRCVSLAAKETVEPEIIRYLNRLSDLLFMLARRANILAGREEINPRFGR
jgi:cob(I)alamin adenosyltransferase